MPLQPLELSVRTVRDGSRLKLVDVSLSAEGREVSRASAQLLVETDSAVELPDTPAAEIPPPSECQALDLSRFGKFQGTFESREARAPGPPGDGRLLSVWSRYSTSMFPGEPISDAARVGAASDRAFASGVMTSEGLAFINSDFTVYLARAPRGEWTAIDGSLRLTERGGALSSAWLRDEEGPFGTVTAVGLAQEEGISADRGST